MNTLIRYPLSPSDTLFQYTCTRLTIAQRMYEPPRGDTWWTTLTCRQVFNGGAV